MSKSAVYAGLGQGLMALGQGVSNAIQTTTIENLRQENLERNWAREDKIRGEDRTERVVAREEDNAYRSKVLENQATTIANQKTYQEGQLARQDKTIEAQKEMKEAELKHQGKVLKASVEDNLAKNKINAERVKTYQEQMSLENMKFITGTERESEKVTREISKEELNQRYNLAAQAMAHADASVSTGGIHSVEYMELETKAEKDKFRMDIARQYLPLLGGLMSQVPIPK